MKGPESGRNPQPRSLVGSILHTLGTIVMMQGAQILAGIVTARAFGPAGKGILSYAAIFVVFGSAAADGLRNAIAFQIGNEGWAPRAVWDTALRIVAAAAPLGALFFLALWRHDPSQLAFLYVAAAFPFAFFLQTVNILYLIRHALERFNVQNAVIMGAGSAATIFAVLVFHANLTVALVIWLCSYIAVALWAALGVRTLLQEKSKVGTPSLLREQLAFTLKGGLSAIVTLLALRADTMVVGSTLSKSALGLYATALAVAELLLTLSRSVSWAATGRIATLERTDAIALTARVVRSLVLVQAIVGMIFVLGGPSAIGSLYGNRFSGSGSLLALLIPRVVFYSADGILSYFIAVRQGRPGILFAFELGTLTLCTIATLAAVTYDGLQGAALAATLTFIAAFFGKLAYFVRISKLSWWEVIALRRDDFPARWGSFFGRR